MGAAVPAAIVLSGLMVGGGVGAALITLGDKLGGSFDRLATGLAAALTSPPGPSLRPTSWPML